MTAAGGRPPNSSPPGLRVSRSNAARRWLTAARDVLDTIERTQQDAIDVAAQVFADAIADGALVHVFGSGHSRMNTEEMFPRIGSFPGFHPIAELAVTNYHAVVGPNGLRQAMYLERDIGFARVVLQQFKIHAGDAFLVFSSTGINGMVVELATLVRRMGLPVVAVTSLAHTSATASRHPSGRKLADVADVAIDNGSPAGDAAVTIDGLPYPVGPTSSIGALSVVNMIKSRTAELLTARGAPPVILTSPHFVGCDDSEDQLERVYDECFRRLARAYDPVDALPVPPPPS